MYPIGSLQDALKLRGKGAPSRPRAPAVSSAHRAAGGWPGRARSPGGRTRALILALVSLSCLAVAVAYVALARGRAAAAVGRPAPAGEASMGTAAAIAALRERPHLLFISTAVGDTYGKIAVAPLEAPDRLRLGTPLRCDRVYFAAGQGLCLGHDVVGGFLSAYSAYTFDGAFEPRRTFRQDGAPSRVRLSPDGRRGAMTVFVSGHSYAEGGFSTLTALVDVAGGAPLGDLEQFAVYRDGVRFQADDFNFWGVTFARGGDRFYASLGSGGKIYLVEGDLPTRQARVLREGVECPSLSPDNTRLAFKRRVGRGDRLAWQLALLDLATLEETPLSAEPRSVDDQVEWLDDGHVLYALAEDGRPATTAAADIWVLPVDGSGAPRIFVPQAYSPAVVR